MSDPNNTQPVQPLSTKTGAVPLKKETVRITLRARPGAGLTQKQPTLAQAATAPVSLQSTAPVQLPASDATSKLPVAPANKATASIQLPSAPLPPPAARAATAPVSLQSTSPVQLPAPSAQPASRSTAVVKLDPATAPVATIGAPPAPAAPRPAAPGAPRPPAAPGAPRPMGAPPAPAMGAPRPPGAPPAPGAPRPPAPAGGAPRPPGAPAAPAPGPLAPTIPMAKAPGAPPAPGAPRPPGAPAAPVAAPPAGGAKVEAGATTVPLAKGPAKPGAAAPAARPGAGAAAAGGATSQLPKATVQLSKAGPGAAAGGAPKPMAQANVPIKRPLPAAEDNAPLYEEKDPEAGLMPLAVVCSILGVAILVLSLFGSDKFFYGNPGEPSALKVPPPILPKWEQPAGDGTYVSSFNKMLSDITSKFE